MLLYLYELIVEGVMNSKDEKLVYTPEEARMLLGVSRGVMYSSLAKNLVPNFKIGKKYIIPKHQFHVWLGEGSAATLLSNSHS